ncbi:MAG: hypothetical protein N3G22_02550 [Candidatus Micrarchaeota archaeon]|nr:hypothetical protein [Candidatus Micrarchaeota archaeon]
MVSAINLFGYLFQAIGVCIMFFGFFQLIGGVQGTFSEISHSMRLSSGLAPSTDTGLSGEVNTEKLFAQKFTSFLSYLISGILFLFLGLIIRSLGEISGALPHGRRGDEKESSLFLHPKWKGPLSP